MQTHHRLFHLPHHHLTNLSVLYIVSTLRTFIISIINVFIPILLLNQFLKNGYAQKEALIMTGLFLFLLIFIMLISVSFVSHVNSKLGLKSGFIISHIFFICFLLLSQIPFSLAIAVLNYVIFGISLCFWWATYHVYFINVGQKKHFGKEISMMEMLSIIAGMIGPIIGGFIITFFGNPTLYFGAIILVVISIFILTRSNENDRYSPVTLEQLWSEIPKHKRDFITFIGTGGVETVYTFIWPIFLYVLVRSFLQIGAIFTGIAVVTFICLYFVSKTVDKTSKAQMERFGSSVVSITWFGKAIFQNSPLILVFDAIFRVFFNTFFIIPLISIAYSHAAHEHKVRYILFREIGYRIGDLIAICFFIFFVYVDIPLWMMFIVAAIFSLLPLVEKE